MGLLKEFTTNLEKKLEQFFLWVNLGAWLLATLMFVIFTIVAFVYPKSFDNYAAGIGFLGITLTFLALFFYIADKINSRDKDAIRDKADQERDMADKERDARLLNIDRICNQWDRDLE